MPLRACWFAHSGTQPKVLRRPVGRPDSLRRWTGRSSVDWKPCIGRPEEILPNNLSRLLTPQSPSRSTGLFLSVDRKSIGQPETLCRSTGNTSVDRKPCVGRPEKHFRRPHFGLKKNTVDRSTGPVLPVDRWLPRATESPDFGPELPG